MGYIKLFSSLNLWRINSGRLLRYFSSLGPTNECDNTAVKNTQNEEQGSSSEGKKSGLVIGVYEDKDKFELSPTAEEINQRSGGKICRYLNELSCRLKLGKAFVVTDVVPEFGPVAISSMGKKNPGYNKLEELDETRENVRVMVGAGVRALCERGCELVSVCAASQPQAAAEAAHLAAWRFEEFKSSADRYQDVKLSLHGSDGQEEWNTGVVYGESQNWARYLTDMPPNKMTPVDFAQAALDTLCPLGVRVTAHERSWLEAQRMRGVLSVAAGSCEAPLLLECEYRGSDDPPVLLAADGLTFDCGGLCLRPTRDIYGARSVTGAAVVVAVLRTLAILKVPINVRAVIPLCEQLVSGHCLKPGDVIPALNGLQVQVEDTDLESQLLLADALVYGQTMYKPSLVIDVACLAPLSAVGASCACACVFTNSEHAGRGLRGAGARSGDRLWPLPLWDYYRKQVRDDPAVDLRNKGSGTSTICKGAAFLRHFVCGDWLHVDTSGVRAGGAVYLRQERASGRPARTIAAFLADAALAGKNAQQSDKHADPPQES